MREEGVTPGTLLFDGVRNGNNYSGRAYVFLRGCGSRSRPCNENAAPGFPEAAFFLWALRPQKMKSLLLMDDSLAPFSRMVSVSTAICTPPDTAVMARS